MNEDLFGDIPQQLVLADPTQFINNEPEMTAHLGKQKHHLNLNLAMTGENGGVKLYLARNRAALELVTDGTKEHMEDETVQFENSGFKSRSPPIGHSKSKRRDFKKDASGVEMHSSLSNDSKSKRNQNCPSSS